MNNRLSVLAYFLCCCFLTSAQIELPPTFVQKLEQAQINISLPLENKFKPAKVDSSKYLPYDFAIRSKKEKLEIRYFIDTFETKDSLFHSIPQVQAMQLVTNLAKNHEDAITAVHGIEPSDLKEKYQADWGMIAYFQPKTAFSQFTDCKMLALFKEGQAIAYVFYLFNEYNDALDKYSMLLSFQ